MRVRQPWPWRPFRYLDLGLTFKSDASSPAQKLRTASHIWSCWLPPPRGAPPPREQPRAAPPTKPARALCQAAPSLPRLPLSFLSDFLPFSLPANRSPAPSRVCRLQGTTHLEPSTTSLHFLHSLPLYPCPETSTHPPVLALPPTPSHLMPHPGICMCTCMTGTSHCMLQITAPCSTLAPAYI